MSDYKKDLLNDLKNRPGYAAKYLTAAAADSTEAFLVALRDVGSARRGMTSLAAAAEVNRVNLYQMLSKKGNPGIRNIRAILDALKLRVRIEEEDSQTSIAPAPSPAPQIEAPSNKTTFIVTLANDYGVDMESVVDPLVGYFYNIQNAPGVQPGFGLNRRMGQGQLGTVRYNRVLSMNQTSSSPYRALDH
jgi:probable addiction module antidote protein